jgi:hypothetical protein
MQATNLISHFPKTKMKSTDEKIITATATAKTVAQLLGLTDKRVRQLGAENKIASADKAGKYPLAKVIRQYCEMLRSRAEAGSITSAKRRRLEAQASVSEMELATRRKELLPTAGVLAVWTARKTAVRDVVLQSGLTKKEQDALLAEFEVDVADYLK